MRPFVTFFMAVLLVLILAFVLPVSGEEAVYSDVLRLHILADSDDTDDQTAKLLVRDALLETYGEDFEGLASKEDAQRYLHAHLGEIEQTVLDTVKGASLSYAVRVELAEEWFDTRSYGKITLPAGTYTALKITLGKGEGQNFWCMLYPALCTEPAKGAVLDRAKAELSEEEYLLVTDSGYAVKLRALEILSAIFK